MQQDKSLSKELMDGLKKKWESFLQWLKPDPDDAIALQIIKTILKIPVLIIVLALSPVALVVLIFAFVVAL